MLSKCFKRFVNEGLKQYNDLGDEWEVCDLSQNPVHRARKAVGKCFTFTKHCGDIYVKEVDRVLCHFASRHIYLIMFLASGVSRLLQCDCWMQYSVAKICQGGAECLLAHGLPLTSWAADAMKAPKYNTGLLSNLNVYYCVTNVWTYFGVRSLSLNLRFPLTSCSHSTRLCLMTCWSLMLFEKWLTAMIVALTIQHHTPTPTPAPPQVAGWSQHGPKYYRKYIQSWQVHKCPKTNLRQISRFKLKSIVEVLLHIWNSGLDTSQLRRGNSGLACVAGNGMYAACVTHLAP